MPYGPALNYWLGFKCMICNISNGNEPSRSYLWSTHPFIRPLSISIYYPIIPRVVGVCWSLSQLSKQDLSRWRKILDRMTAHRRLLVPFWWISIRKWTKQTHAQLSEKSGKVTTSLFHSQRFESRQLHFSSNWFILMLVILRLYPSDFSNLKLVPHCLKVIFALK